MAEDIGLSSPLPLSLLLLLLLLLSSELIMPLENLGLRGSQGSRKLRNVGHHQKTPAQRMEEMR